MNYNSLLNLIQGSELIQALYKDKSLEEITSLSFFGTYSKGNTPSRCLKTIPISKFRKDYKNCYLYDELNTYLNRHSAAMYLKDASTNEVLKAVHIMHTSNSYNTTKYIHGMEEDYKAYKLLKSSDDFIARVKEPCTNNSTHGINLSNQYFDYSGLINIYHLLHMNIEARFNLVDFSDKYFLLWAKYSSPLKNQVVLEFERPIHYDSGVAVERGFIDEWSANYYRPYYIVRETLRAAYAKSFSERNPYYAAEALIKEGFSLFMKNVQCKKFKLNELSYETILICTAKMVVLADPEKEFNRFYKINLKSNLQLYEPDRKGMFNLIAQEYDKLLSSLILEYYTMDPGEVYKKYMLNNVINVSKYPKFYIRENDEVRRWKPENIKAWKKNNNVTNKIKCKEVHHSQNQLNKMAERRKKVKELLGQGYSKNKIAQITGYSKNTVIKIVKELGL